MLFTASTSRLDTTIFMFENYNVDGHLDCALSLHVTIQKRLSVISSKRFPVSIVRYIA